MYVHDLVWVITAGCCIRFLEVISPYYHLNKPKASNDAGYRPLVPVAQTFLRPTLVMALSPPKRLKAPNGAGSR